jgi:hypothetical protein
MAAWRATMIRQTNLQVGTEYTGAKAAASAPWSHSMAGHQLPILCLDLGIMPNQEWQVMCQSMASLGATGGLGGSEHTADASDLERVVVATGGAGVLRRAQYLATCASLGTPMDACLSRCSL